MEDDHKTKKQLINELTELRHKLAEIKKYEKNQKDNYESLMEYKNRYRTLFDRSLYCVYLHDLEGNLFDANETALKLFGYTKKELLSINILSLIPEEQRPIALKRIEGIFRHGSQKKPHEYMVKKKNGEYIWLEVEGALIMKHGKPYAIQGIARDITEQKQAATLLKASEAKYKDLYDNAPDMFVSVDPATAQIIECNKTLLNATGYGREEIIGRTVFDLYNQDSLEDAKKAFKKFLETGVTRNAELQIRRKDGSNIAVCLNVSAVRDEKGNIIHSRSIFRDITGRKLAEQALKQKEKELKRRVKELEEFYDMAVGREIRMKQLKAENDTLKTELGRYKKE